MGCRGLVNIIFLDVQFTLVKKQTCLVYFFNFFFSLHNIRVFCEYMTRCQSCQLFSSRGLHLIQMILLWFLKTVRPSYK